MKFKVDKILTQLMVLTAVILLIISWFVLPSARAASLTWDYPGDSQWDKVTGYNIYYSDSEGQEFNKTIQKSEAIANATIVQYQGIEDKLQLRHCVEYTIYMTAFNEREESVASNTCVWIHPGYEPPEDHLPSTIIHIVGPVTITIGQD